MGENNALAVQGAQPPAVVSDPAQALLENYQWRMDRAGIIRRITGELKAKYMKRDVHFGKIGNTDKDVLLQPGADMLLSTLHMRPEFTVLPSSIVDYGDEQHAPTLRYDVECRIVDIQSGEVLATAIGSCNNREKKYAYRWVLFQDVPEFLDPDKLVKQTTKVSERDFAIKLRETTGKYGKPEEYWQDFDTAIHEQRAVRKTFPPTKSGKVDQGWEIITTLYRIPNMEAADLDNTLIKMAAKRAKVSGAIFVTASGDLFTADLEDQQPQEIIPYAAPTAPTESDYTPPAETSAAFDGVNTDLGQDPSALNYLIQLAATQRKIKPPAIWKALGREIGSKLDGIGFRDALEVLKLTMPDQEKQADPLPFDV